MEGFFLMPMGLFTYPGAIRSLCLFPGRYYQYPVYEAFLSEGRFWSPDGGQVLGAALLLLWTERVLMLLGLGRRQRLLLAGGLVLAALSWGWGSSAIPRSRRRCGRPEASRATQVRRP